MLREIKTGSEHYFVDDQDYKHGEYKSIWENGQAHIQCFFVNGKYHGEYKSWHPNGRLKGHCFFVNDRIHSEYKNWYKDGVSLAHGFYVNGKYTNYHIPKQTKIVYMLR